MIQSPGFVGPTKTRQTPGNFVFMFLVCNMVSLSYNLEEGGGGGGRGNITGNFK